MKKSTLMLSVAAVVATTALPVLAIPRAGEADGRTALISSYSLPGMVAGVDYRTQPRRQVHEEGSGKVNISHAVMFIGYDFDSWITLYVLGGGGMVKGDTPVWRDNDQYNEGAFTYGGGAMFDFLQYDLASTLTTVQSFSVQGMAQFSTFKTRNFGRWNEFTGNVTVGLINDVIGSKSLMPQRISIFAGPCYAAPVAKKNELSKKDRWGVLTGAGLTFNSRASLSGSVEFYTQEMAASLSAAYRF